MGAEGEKFYHLSEAELLRKLEVTHHGLTDVEAKRRLKQSGLNELSTQDPVSIWQIYLSQFQNSLTLILLASAGLIFFVWYFGDRADSDLIEASLILAIVFMITLLGFFQEWKAEKAIDALKKLLAFKAQVIRSGKTKEIDVKTLVVGDVVILEEGTKVPADIRLIEVANLATNEASLTGESAPVHKMSDPLDGTPAIADQKNTVFAGTIITQGRATGLVIRTGNATEIGQIATTVASIEEEDTPIQQRLDRVGKTVGYAVLGIASLVFVFIFFFAPDYQNLPLIERLIHAFVAAVALAVAAIPEGLPAVVTISLALGTQRMLKRNALVRKLNAIETLGSTDVICADKTGTLTKGEMTVRHIYVNHTEYAVSGSGYDPKGEISPKSTASELSLILKAGLLANNAHMEQGKILGDPTEAALLVSAAKGHVTAHFKRIKEEPFSSERKMMSVLVREKNDYTVYAKGAPETLLKTCKKISLDGKVVALTPAHAKKILEQTSQMSTQALRTLGFAYKPAERTTTKLESDLIFLGLQGMIDPPRTEIKPVIQTCYTSGIRVIMITGDHGATATAVAKEIGIEGKTMTGDELDSLSEAAFSKVVTEVNIYARVNPNFKMRIIDTLKKQGHIVAMTGDGVNDAPALKKADIGIAMGINGTDVAKEASDMILLDDHFNTIVAAIEEGRGVFDNIRKFVNYLLSSNMCEVLVVLLGLLLFQDVLLTATMLLWINVITDGLPAVALGMDPAQKGIMRFSPKEFQGEIIPKPLWREMFLMAALLTTAILGIYVFNLPEGQAEARAAAFMAMVILELLRLYHIRARYRTALTSNIWLIVAVASSIGLQLLIVSIPFFANLFAIQPIDIYDWLFILIAGIVIWFIFKPLQQLIHKTA